MTGAGAKEPKQEPPAAIVMPDIATALVTQTPTGRADSLARTSIDPTTRPTQAGSASEGSATGHLTHSVPYTASGSMLSRRSDFIRALPARP